MTNPDNSGRDGSGTLNDFIKLELTRTPWHLRIEAQVDNYDLALAMLDQARRWFEQQLRIAGALEAQNQMRRAAEDAEIAATVRATKR